jgi:ABC-type branched-subunit amino acid transport system substrate-binding protein
VILATAFSLEGLSDRGRDFARRYQERFHEPPDLSAALACDAIRFLLDAMQGSGATGGPRLRDALARTDPFESVTGSVTFGGEHQARRKVFLVAVRGGAARLVQTLDGD